MKLLPLLLVLFSASGALAQAYPQHYQTEQQASANPYTVQPYAPQPVQAAPQHVPQPAQQAPVTEPRPSDPGQSVMGDIRQMNF